MLSFREDLTFSQRIEEFKVFAKNEKGEYVNLYVGTVVGSRKIVKSESSVNTDEVLVIITKSRSNPVIRDIKIYG